MGISVFPAPSGGGIKSVQRGSAAGSGNVTITAVDIAKSFVTVFGSASSGTVSVSGGVSANTITLLHGFNDGGLIGGNNASKTLNIAATNLTGGSNNLVAAVVQGYLSNSTTLVVSGACRWEVVEFN